MRNLFFFTSRDRNEKGGITISYDGDAAGDMLAKAACDAFIATQNFEDAEIISGSQHFVQPDAFDEEREQWFSYTWLITVPPHLFAKLSSKQDRSSFKSRIFELDFSEFEQLHDILINIAPHPDGDWRTRAQSFLTNEATRATGAEIRSDEDDSRQFTPVSPEHAPVNNADPRKVFVVHGRDDAFTQAFREFLRSLDLAPMEWSEAAALTRKPSPYLNEVLQAALRVAQGVVILLTPDNEGRLREGLWGAEETEDEKQLRFHPRQNVLYEAGLAFGLAAERTVIVKAGPVMINSDLHGLNYVGFSGDAASRARLAQRLVLANCAVNIAGESWLSSGKFPDYSNLSEKAPKTLESPQESEAEIDERAFMIQPRLHLQLHSGSGGPDGQFITGFVRNIGRGIAFNASMLLPGIGGVPLDGVLKPGETVERKMRYDDKDIYTKPLADTTAWVKFEDDLGNVYQQQGQVVQNSTPSGSILTYEISSLGRVKFLGKRP